MAKKLLQSVSASQENQPTHLLASSSPNLVKGQSKPMIAIPATSSGATSAPSNNALSSSAQPTQSQAPNSSESSAIMLTKMPAIESHQISLAVKTLIDYSNKTMKKKMAEGELFADDVGTNDCFVSLVISLKRIANRERHKPVRINLTHPLLDPRVSPVCLIVKDPQREYKDLLEKKRIKFISKVVGIAKLRGKHSSFEARRLLLNSHALFLADERVLRILPSILGSKFFQSKKLPLSVTLTDPRKLKAELEKAISSTWLRLGSGSCVNIKIGDLSRHTEAQLKDNLIQVLEQLGKKIPMGGWANIQGVHIKTGTSISLPIWLSELNNEVFGRFSLTPTPAEQERIKAFELKKKASLEARNQAKISKKRRIDSKIVSDAEAETMEPALKKQGAKSEESHAARLPNQPSGPDPQAEKLTSGPKRIPNKKASEISEPLAPEPAANLTIEASEGASESEPIFQKDRSKTKPACKNQLIRDGAAKSEATLDTKSKPSTSRNPVQPSSTTSTQAVDASKPPTIPETPQDLLPVKAKKHKKDKLQSDPKPAQQASPLAPIPDTAQTSLVGKAKKHKKDKPQSDLKLTQQAKPLADKEADCNTDTNDFDAPKPVSTIDAAKTSLPGKAKKHKNDRLQSDSTPAQQTNSIVNKEAGSDTGIKEFDAPNLVSANETAQTSLPGKAKKHKKVKLQSDSNPAQQANPRADKGAGCSNTDTKLVDVLKPATTPETPQTSLSGKTKKTKKDKSQSASKPAQQANSLVDEVPGSNKDMKSVDVAKSTSSVPDASNTSLTSKPKKDKKKDKLMSKHEPTQKAITSVDTEATSKMSVKTVDAPQPSAGSEAAKTPSPGKTKKPKKDKAEVVQTQAKAADEKEESSKREKASKKPVGDKDGLNSKGKPRSSVGEKARGLSKVKVDGTVSKKG